MLGAYVIVAELACFFERKLDDALGPRREDHFLLHGLAAAADDGFHLGTYFGEIDTQRFQDFGSETLTLADDAQQDVLGADVVVAEALRFFLRKDDASSRALGERLPHGHTVIDSSSGSGDGELRCARRLLLLIRSIRHFRAKVLPLG